MKNEMAGGWGESVTMSCHSCLGNLMIRLAVLYSKAENFIQVCECFGGLSVDKLSTVKKLHF